MSDNNDDILQQLRDILGEAGIREQPDDNMPDIVLKPGSIEEVSAILKVCHDHGQALVPLGGRTGLAGGHFETAAGEFGLSLERMNTIEEIDTVNRTMTVQAGCILQVAAEAAEEQDLLLPLDFGARGSATL
ncbi:MAG: FAD-binding oxidoreductase, partial [Halioglobus sp.]